MSADPLPPTEAAKQAVDRILYRTTDPTTVLDGRPVPAITALLYKVCDNDGKKFEEATRLVELFIAEALNDAT